MRILLKTVNVIASLAVLSIVTIAAIFVNKFLASLFTRPYVYFAIYLFWFLLVLLAEVVRKRDCRVLYAKSTYLRYQWLYIGAMQLLAVYWDIKQHGTIELTSISLPFLDMLHSGGKNGFLLFPWGKGQQNGEMEQPGVAQAVSPGSHNKVVAASGKLVMGETQDLARILRELPPEEAAALATESLHSALLIAAFNKKDTVALLLDYGADPNKPGKRDIVPLLFVILRNEKACAALLLAHGANPNAMLRDNRITLLGMAAASRRNDIARMLLEHGAYVNVPNYQGNTPLHFAARRGNLAGVQLLLEAGANPCARNDEGNTPLDIAAKPDSFPRGLLVNAGRRQVAEFLRVRLAN